MCFIQFMDYVFMMFCVWIYCFVDFAFAAFELAVPAAKVGFRPVSALGQAVSALSLYISVLRPP